MEFLSPLLFFQIALEPVILPAALGFAEFLLQVGFGAEFFLEFHFSVLCVSEVDHVPDEADEAHAGIMPDRRVGVQFGGKPTDRGRTKRCASGAR